MMMKCKHSGYSRDGLRRVFKSGGGDGGAQAMENARLARVANATNTINALFGVGAGNEANLRDSMYADQRSAVYDLNSREVERQAGEAERANRFGLARSGLLGGSVDVDSNADLNRRTNEGLLQAGGIADQSAADLRASDEQTRSNLISLAQSGIDTGTAASMALAGQAANSANAASQLGGSTVGNLFDGMSNAYLYNQQATGAKAGYGNTGGQWYGVSNPRTGDSGSTSR